MLHMSRNLTLMLVFAITNVATSLVYAAPPQAFDDTVSTQVNTATLISVLGNDTSDPGTNLISGTVNIKRPYRRGILALRDGQVRFTPKTDFIGDETFTYTVRDDLGFISNPATVTVTINGKPTDITLSATTLPENRSVGTPVGTFTTTDPNAGDTHTYSLVAGAGSTDNNVFQISGNSLQTAAVLDFEAQASYNIRVRSTDSGAGNLFFEKAFTITVTDLNEVPVFVVGPNQIVNEDAGAQTVNTWATGINDGDTGSVQTLSFSVTNNTNAALFSTQPEISPSGALTYTPAANANGVASVSVRLTDSGSNVAPNVNASAEQIFTISINAVNDAPSFTASNPPSVNEDTGGQSVNAWAAFSAGPSNEIGEAVQSYNVINVGNPGLFNVQPSVDTNGTLSYSVAANANGSSTFTVTVTDNGGTANGGINTSASQQFTITVDPINDAPVAANKSFTAHTNMKVAGLTGLLDGVTDDDNGINGCTPTFSVAGIANQAGGTFSVVNASTGTFDFDPNPGFTGTATATYTVQDNGCPGIATSASANISVTVGGTRIWFVNASASGTNDGRLSNPFTSLASVDNVDAINDRIFVFTGSYPVGLLTLFDGEQLIGQGVSGANFDTLFGITPPSGTIARPSINGTRPTIQDTVTLSNNNVVRGLNIATTGEAALADIGTTIANVTVNEVIASSNTTTVNLTDISSSNIGLDSTNSTGGVNNVNLSNVSGTVNLGGGALSGATGASFNVATGIGIISYNGTIGQATAGQRPVVINGKSGGSVTFGGAITANTGSTTGISLTSNTGATITFQGGMTLSTGANTAFAATGGGTVNVCDEALCNPAAIGTLVNTLTTSTGTALNVDNTTIGANRLEFRSISANAAVNGIVLNNTGSAGGLTVTGDSSGLCGGQVTPAVTVGNSADCTGGTIQSTTGDAIKLTNTANVSLTRMRIVNIAGTDNNGIDATELSGSNFFRNSQMDNVASSFSNGNGISLVNTNTTLTLFSVEDSFFANSPSQTSHVLSRATGSGNVRLDVRRSIFQNLVALAVQSNAGDVENATHTVTTNIVGNVFRNASVTNGQGGIAVANAEQNATHNFVVSDNVFEDLIKGIAGGNAEILLSQTVGGSLAGTVSGNILGTSTAGNGDRRGIGVISEPDVTVNGELGSVDIIIDGNTVDRLPSREGSFIDLREDTQNSELIVRNNNFGQLAGFQGLVGGDTNKLNLQREALDIQSRGEVTRTLNMLVSNNNIRANTSVNVVNLETNIDNSTLGNLSTHATVTGNTFKNDDAAGGAEIITRPRDATSVTTVCLDMSGNTLDGGVGSIDLNETGVLNVEQASAALLASGNSIPSGNVLITGGAPSFGVICSNPPN